MIEPLKNRLQAHRATEGGWVIVTAMALMAIMVSVGLAVLAATDTQSRESGRERVRESAFNFAEGLLQAQSVVLQNNWPTGPQCAGNLANCGYAWTLAAPDTCTQATAGSNTLQCPDPTRLIGTSGAFSNVDQVKNATWKVQVRDDLGVKLDSTPVGYTPFYSSGQVPIYYKGQCPPPNEANKSACWPATPSEPPGVDQTACKDSSNNDVVCTWDANGNDQVWVRVDSTVGGKTRSLVALLHLEEFPVNVSSEVAVSGGTVNFTNTGNKDVVDATGSYIIGRCNPSTGATPNVGTKKTTTLVSVNSADTITVADNPNAFDVDNVVAIGVAKDATGSVKYELLTVRSVDPAAKTIRFRSNIVQSHSAGAKVELAPNPTSDSKSPNNCISWSSPLPPDQNGADKHQLTPYQNYITDPNWPDLMDDATFAAVTATMFPWNNACPSNWNGDIYIEMAPAGGCTIPNGTFNSEAKPHFIIVKDQFPGGTCGSDPSLTLSGSTVFYGVIYFVNNQNCSFTQLVAKMQAGAQILGGVAVDGNGKVDIGAASNSQGTGCAIKSGSSCPTVKFDEVAWKGLAGSGAAGLVQNTWRELAPGQ